MNAELLRDPSRAGLFRLQGVDRATLVAAGLEILEADVAGCSDKQAVLEKLGRDLRFPDWYGANLDALYDCLTDLDADKGLALLITGLEDWHRAEPTQFAILADVLRSASDYYRDSGLPFWILADAADEDIPAA